MFKIRTGMYVYEWKRDVCLKEEKGCIFKRRKGMYVQEEKRDYV